jgi:hypothetical protein
MANDFDDHRRIFDSGDDLQGAAAPREAFDVDVENRLSNIKGNRIRSPFYSRPSCTNRSNFTARGHEISQFRKNQKPDSSPLQDDTYNYFLGMLGFPP